MSLEETPTPVVETPAKSIFMFSGQGSQYYHMGQPLFEQNPLFRVRMQQLDEIAIDVLGESVLAQLYHPDKSKSSPFLRTRYTHPAIFMVQYALAEMLIAEDIRPDVVLGASLGEYVALAVSGILSAEDTLITIIKLAVALEEYCVPGGMLAVLESPEFFRQTPELYQQSELAAISFDTHFVISGTQAALTKIEYFLRQRQILSQPVAVSLPFHSQLMEAAAEACNAALIPNQFQSPQVPFISSVLGQELVTIDADYLWRVGREPINFQTAIAYCEAKHPACYLDLGPSGTLANYARYNLTENSHSKVYPSLAPFGSNAQTLENLRILRADVSKHSSEKINIIRKTPAMTNKAITTWVFPGQGSQMKGMGKDLFDAFPDLTRQADDILGYSIKELCLQDPQRQLGKTQYTQPALYVVNALSFLQKSKETSQRPDFVAGHSLGEYNALLASGAFDFATGLQLVKRRGELMSTVRDGGMAAISAAGETVEEFLQKHQLTQLDVANYNAPQQTVISGPVEAIKQAVDLFSEENIGALALNVSASFHSRYMQPTQEQFAETLRKIEFSALQIPVIANVSARPYQQNEVATNLTEQISGSVQWVDSVRYLMGAGDNTFSEIGPRNVLTTLIKKIQKDCTPLILAPVLQPTKSEAKIDSDKTAVKTSVEKPASAQIINIKPNTIKPEDLGSREFREDYGLKYAYLAGAMAKGIGSKEIVVKMGKAGLMAFFGAGGLPLADTEVAIQYIQAELNNDEAYGMNVLHHPDNPQLEEDTVDLVLKYGIRVIEASAFMQITSALVKYRLAGITQHADGWIESNHKIIAKISRPEIAELFLSPAPPRIIDQLLQSGKITKEAAQLANHIPMADDLCVEADSGGHTDGGIMPVLLPTIIRQRDVAMAQHGYPKRIRVGAAGGIGTPESAATAFMLGADFILAGSINQCTVEADTSDAAKDILQQINVQDTEYAPAGDMFELGAKVQVARKGLFFPARANKLYDLYRNHKSLDEIDSKIRGQLQNRYFQRSFDEVCSEVKTYYEQLRKPEEIDKAEQNPKHKMALIFKWYFGYSMRLAKLGDIAHKVDFQIHCGPAMGAFNQWVSNTDLENWQNRHVDVLGEKIMQETAVFLEQRMQTFYHKGV